MKKRNPIAVALLSLFTFGIYGLYWLASTRKVLIRTTNQIIPSIWWLIVPFILAVGLYVAAFVPLILSAPTPKGSTPQSNFVYLFIAYGLSILAMTVIHIYWYFKYSKAVDDYTNKQMSTAISFILLYLVNFIGMALIQDAFNSRQDTTAIKVID